MNTQISLAACAIFRNEGKYIQEWIEFHQLVGIKKFYLYNNRSTDNYLEILNPYIEKNIVDLTEWNHLPPCQVQAYQHFIDRTDKKVDWVFFGDIDEFLWSPKYNTVTEVLDTVPNSWDAVGVNWMCFGSSGRNDWEDAPVIERFTWRRNSDIPANHYIKSIVRTNHKFAISDPHFAYVPTFTPSGNRISGSHSVNHEYDLLQVNHYGSKSRNEWVTRQLLGKPHAPFSASTEQCYNDIQGFDVDDRGIRRFLPALKERLK